ncbi:MAG: DNA polymerase III subunit delta [Anaerovoracaceae bacterium]|nr:DNA polymerase III subunit delta [Bacillota bacterium]MDY2670385.1 DNA polymerase III subunit delta [Anaerovoracaceae bacterium]
MAWSRAKSYGYEDALAELKRDALPRVAVMHGREDYLIRWMAGQIRSKYINEAAAMFDYADVDGFSLDSAQPVIDACEMLPVMSEKKIVRISDLNPKSPAVAELAGYMDSVPDSTILLFTMPDAGAMGKAFSDAAKKAGRIYEFSKLKRPTLSGFIRKYLKQGGVKFTPETVDLIIDISGYYDRDSDYTLDNLRSDIEKISLFAGGSSVSAEEVEEIVLGNAEKDRFAFTDALAEGRRSDALKILGSILSHGGEEFNILGLICSQYEVMMLIQEAAERGAGRSYLEKELKINSYRIKMLSKPASKYTSDELKRILLRAYDIDRNVKNGLMDAKLGLEMFIAEI